MADTSGETEHSQLPWEAWIQLSFESSEARKVFCGCKIHKNHLLIFMSQGSKAQSRKRTGRDGLLSAIRMLWTSGDQEAWRNDTEAEDLKNAKPHLNGEKPPYGNYCLW